MPVPSDRKPWEPGTLWAKLKAQRHHGLLTGALQPVETTVECIESRGIRFVVRILSSLVRKEKARQQQGKSTAVNPFLPYEQDLYVTDVSETHLCLLNKFNVVDHHFLIVTRAFEPQEHWLTLADFDALVRCLEEVDGLGFYNGGTLAGASQPHKHLQIVPRVSDLCHFPMAQAIASAQPSELVSEALCSPHLPFRHGIAQLDGANPQHYLSCYQALLQAVGLSPGASWQGPQTGAYNLLCNRQWMMVVPRSQEKYAGISVNSLGFAGSLLVKSHEKLSQLKAIGPMQLLLQVGCNDACKPRLA